MKREHVFAIISLSFATATASGVGADETRVAVYPPLPNNTCQSQHYAVTVEQGGKRFPCYVYQSDNHGDLDAYHLERMTAANHFTSFDGRGHHAHRQPQGVHRVGRQDDGG